MRSNPKVGIIVQARMGSTRLPGKVLKKILGRSLLDLQIERLKRCRKASSIILATSTLKQDDPIAEEARRLQVNCFRGSELDLLDRYFQAASEHKLDWVVRVTADCPVIDPEILDEVIEVALSDQYDSLSLAALPGGRAFRTYPHGLDFQIFRMSALSQAHQEAKLPEEREHVGIYLERNPEKFRVYCHSLKEFRGLFRVTVDYPEDFERIQKIYEALYPKKPHFNWRDCVEWMSANRKRILFVVDNRPEVGLGHLSRCEAIAGHLLEKAVDVGFLKMSDAKMNPRFESEPIHPNRSCVKLSLENLDVLLNRLRSFACRDLFIDSYAMEKNLIDELRRNSIRVYGIDDFGEKADFSFDGIFHFFDESYRGKSTKIFSGLKYYPLRSEIQNEKARPALSESLQKVLISQMKRRRWSSFSKQAHFKQSSTSLWVWPTPICDR